MTKKRLAVEFSRRIIYNRTMKDLIEERDKKDKMKHSIVKWWNVHYMTPEELEEEQEKELTSDVPQMSGDLDAAQEIIDRLNREAAEDEARKQREIEQARRLAEENFNETTGAYSGAYGSEGIDHRHKEQIDAILAEKDEALRDLIERSGGDE